MQNMSCGRGIPPPTPSPAWSLHPLASHPTWGRNTFCEHVFIFLLISAWTIFQEIHPKYTPDRLLWVHKNVKTHWWLRLISPPTPIPPSLARFAPLPAISYFSERVCNNWFWDRQYSNKFTQIMLQIAYYEPPECKNSVMWEGEYPFPHPPPLGRFTPSPGIPYLRKTCILLTIFIFLLILGQTIFQQIHQGYVPDRLLWPPKCQNSVVWEGGYPPATQARF